MAWVQGKDAQKELYSIFLKKNDYLEFVQKILKLTGCEISEAKATYLHLAAPGRKCHRCESALEQGNIVDCKKCNSVNIIWEQDDT
jgi:hypothetical protein